MEVDFKLYSAKDKADVLEMMASFNAIDGYPFDLETGEKNLMLFTSNQALGRLYLIKVGATNVGYIILTFGFSFEYEGRDAFIDEFYLNKDYRNHGISKITMDFVESEAIKLDIKAIHLEVESHNTHANGLYFKKGYQQNNRALLSKRIEG